MFFTCIGTNFTYMYFVLVHVLHTRILSLSIYLYQTNKFILCYNHTWVGIFPLYSPYLEFNVYILKQSMHTQQVNILQHYIKMIVAVHILLFDKRC